MDEDDEEEIDWETIELPQNINEQSNEMQKYKDVEITFQAPEAIPKKPKWKAEYQRNLREWIHNSHIVTLVAHHILRNRWCSNEKILSQSLKIIPEHIRKLLCMNPSDSNITTGIKSLVKWWQGYFSITGPGLTTRPFNDFANIKYSTIQKMIDKEPSQNPMLLNSPNDFLMKLSKREGTCDVYSELFVAILRSCGCQVRLICSLQPVPYKIPPDSTKNKSNETKDSKDEQPELLFQFRTPMKSYQDQNIQMKQTDAKPPIVWAEVYFPESKRWVCVDQVRGIIDKPSLMEPATLDRCNQLSFILAFDEKKKHCVTDVTRRYTSNMDRAIRLRGRQATKRERSAGIKPWHEYFLENLCFKRKIGEKEELELSELETQEKKEKMPTSIGAFKNHSSFALERHLKKFEIIYPKDNILGSIKGEKIYPRQCVKEVCTAETFRRQGREVIKGQQPIKMVKSNATTIEKKRMNEMAKQSGQEVLTPCYGEWQTQKILPDPVVDGKVPKNSYGNIDLFTPEMLPAGAIHIPIKGIGKIARKLQIDYADAVTGFEFVKMRSVPIIEGIVTPQESQYIIMEALEEQEQNEAVKAIKKQEKEVYMRWRKLIKSLVIKARVDREYGVSKVSDETNGDDSDIWATFNNGVDRGGGGFLSEEE